MSRILVVDDNTDVLVSLQLLLECVGYQVYTANNGAEGLQLYREKQPEVVITDLAMPVMDGIEMMGALRAEYPDSRIIAISGFNPDKQADCLSVADNIGAVETFVKPVKPDALLRRIEELVGPPRQAASA